MRYDLVIVGGGLVGAGLAAALQHTNMRIALIDARVPDNNDPRLFALNHYSCQFLKNLDIWSELSKHASAIHQVHVSAQGRFGVVRLHREDVNLSELGFVVPAKYIEGALNEILRRSAPQDDSVKNNVILSAAKDLHLYRPAKLHAITQHPGHATLHLDVDGKEITIEASIVIAADGADSTVRKQLQIPTETVDYQQSAIVTRTSLKRSHHNIAYERFNSQGAIAMLPLPDNECATIWTIENDAANELMALDDEAFRQKLQATFGYRVGQLQKISKRHCFPLQLVKAKIMVQGSVLLLGNSAHAMHPIAAQGFNLALYEVAMLVDAISKKLTANQPVTAADLEAVSKLAASHQQNSIDISHRLASLFVGDSFLKNHALSLGMTSLNMIKPAKAKFINVMMGRSGALPRLLMSTKDEEHFTAAN